MSAAKHTSAPWIVSSAHGRATVIIGGPTDNVAICSLHPADFDSDVGAWDHGPATAANAKLIASAPVLRAAAESMLAAFGGNVPDWLRAEFDGLAAAVKQAEGGAR